MFYPLCAFGLPLFRKTRRKLTHKKADNIAYSARIVSTAFSLKTRRKNGYFLHKLFRQVFILPIAKRALEAFVDPITGVIMALFAVGLIISIIFSVVVLLWFFRRM